MILVRMPSVSDYIVWNLITRGDWLLERIRNCSWLNCSTVQFDYLWWLIIGKDPKLFLVELQYCPIWLLVVTDYWKGSETVPGWIAVLSNSLLRKSEDNHQKKIQNSCFPGWDLNLVPSECKSEVRFQVYTVVVEIFTFLWCYVALVVIYWKWTH